MTHVTINEYDYGDKVRLTAAFTDSADLPADPTTVTLKYKKPGAAVTTLVYNTDPEIVKDSVGNYHADIALDAEGTWPYRWEGTGAVVAAGEKTFYVKDSVFY